MLLRESGQKAELYRILELIRPKINRQLSDHWLEGVGCKVPNLSTNLRATIFEKIT